MPRTTQFSSPRRAVSLLLLTFILGTGAFSQDLPDKIRGYKVYTERISVKSGSAGQQLRSDAAVTVGEPSLVEAGIAGVTFELPAEALSAKQSGMVHLLSFHEVKVNGLSVDVEDYVHPFSFKKGEIVALPGPARIFLPTTAIVQAAWREMSDSKENWTVTGRVFVFGKFRKFGMYHKRVVPVDFELTFKNPLRTN